MSDTPLNDLLESVLGAVPEPMLYLDATGTVAVTNLAACQLFGDWITGRNYATVLRQPGLLGRIEAAQSGEKGGESRFELPDTAGVTQFRVRITPLPVGPDRSLRANRVPVLLHFTDITHLREAEEMRRDFVANVSHELRTPLTAVMGFIETLRGPARSDPAAQDRFLGIMEAEARRMNRLVSDLLSLSRVESQERMRPSDEVDLSAVLDGVVAALRPAAQDSGNTLEIERHVPDGQRTVIQGDRDQLMQVFLNLAENALKYGGPNKPVTLRLVAEAGSGSMKGTVLRVDVIDRGEGIEARHIPRLTERFYRIDTHRSREMGGTGLGLAIVKHIVNRHRGRLRISSVAGQGSTFSAIFPAV
ncbi:hypothetical protein KUV65_02875 [Maritalea mobilis]|uniref:histidine kinase n=1 Tax=[Roseibacterium] beibuensis TaxID=1193142 RepID=A0ABP9L229_9RHOB|nr:MULTISPECIES: ATP-binding protein [Alphaproteobacteria]MBY6200291.1 hypothetical protein [Maritalea mobilis]MCS6621394.1 ATP-binding protein [Roseibacterium beibuensis]